MNLLLYMEINNLWFHYKLIDLHDFNIKKYTEQLRSSGFDILSNLCPIPHIKEEFEYRSTDIFYLDKRRPFESVFSMSFI